MQRRLRGLLCLAVSLWSSAGLAPAWSDFPSAAPTSEAVTPVRFSRKVLTSEYYCDGINVGDINRDGRMDVVAGPFWYAGPDFESRHAFYPPVPLVREASPSNSMFSFVHDFSGDGWPDILVLGRVHKHSAYWYENPAKTGATWRKHFVFERIRGESPQLVDLNGDGRPQLICHWEGRWGWVTPQTDPTKPWTFHGIGPERDWPQFYHGQGVGDVDGDGRLDLLINDGWFQQPASAGPDWTFHEHRFASGRGGAQMFCCDVDADGDADVLSAIDGHGWGLAWFEQSPIPAGAGFQQRLIMSDRSRIREFGAAFSQPHALAAADVDGDGLTDLVCGKRMWAHGPAGDVEPGAAPVLYWFQLLRDADGNVHYQPHRVDERSGVGVQIQAVDVNADGRVDLLTASKLGTFVFLQQ